MLPLTIFTPTYNRMTLLPKLYTSLVTQTNKNFEWLIVDDGSQDSTKELVKEWILMRQIKIRYYYQPNGGKMRAHNRGVKEAAGELFMCVDSDDYLFNEYVVNKILNHWEQIKQFSDVAGIIAYKNIVNKGFRINEFPSGIKQSTISGLYSKGFKGDTSLIFRVNVLAHYPFPDIKGEKFITEAYIYDQIDLKYKMTLLPDMLMTCEYMADGYSRSFYKLFIQNPQGWSLYYQQKIKQKSGLKGFKFLPKYLSASILVNNNSLYSIISHSNHPFMAILLLPLGWALSVRAKIKANY